MKHQLSAPDWQSERQRMLVEINVNWLSQALAILSSINDQAYAVSPAQMDPHKVGGHLRHILEFYECFLGGLETMRIDYDSRKRDNTIATSRQAASARITAIVNDLQTNPLLRKEALLLVRAEDAEELALTDPFLPSSIARELLTLSSHTIHHFALIAMTLRAHGVEIHPDFGMAPSTLSHREKIRAAEAA
jgi:hypothetical protein